MTRRGPYTTNTLENICIDLNVIVDIVLERAGFEGSLEVVELADSGDVQLYISSHIVTTFAYLLESAKIEKAEIRKYLDWMLMTFLVIPTDQVLLYEAVNSRLIDFEDAVIERVARNCKASYIITRNIKDFKNSLVKAVLPEEYLKIHNN